MTGTGGVILVVVVAVALVAIVAGVTMMQRTRLRPLPDDAKARYAQMWSAIQARFVEDPRAAVGEADRLAVSILRDRGAQMGDEGKLPRELTQARATVGGDQGRQDTEAMRTAMLRYGRIFDDAAGASMRKPLEGGRREVA